jgi:hypothetical protein
MLAALVIICSVTSVNDCDVKFAPPMFQTQEACNQAVDGWIARNDKALKAQFHGDYVFATWCREIKGVES